VRPRKPIRNAGERHLGGDRLLLRLAVMWRGAYEAIGSRPSAPWRTSCSATVGLRPHLSALDFHLGPVAEVALVWRPGEERAMRPSSTPCSALPAETVVVGAAEGDAAAAGLPRWPSGPPWAAGPPPTCASTTSGQLPVTSRTRSHASSTLGYNPDRVAGEVS